MYEIGTGFICMIRTSNFTKSCRMFHTAANSFRFSCSTLHKYAEKHLLLQQFKQQGKV